MKQLNLICLTLLSLLFFATTIKSQQNSWQQLSAPPGNAKVLQKKLSLSQPRLYQLNISQLRSQLKGAPLRSARITSSKIVSFPNEQGTLENFAVVESPNMEPALAAKFPDIKSYIGKGITNPGQKIYFSVSPQGVQSMMIRPGKPTVFLEPYTADRKSYVVFSEAEISLSPLECKILDEGKHLSASSGYAMRSTLENRPNADEGLLRTYRLALSCSGEYGRYFGGTVAGAMAGMNATMTVVNAIFERDFGIHMNMVADNDKLIYLDPATDPYNSNPNQNNWVVEVDTNVDEVIGQGNFDVAHVLIGFHGGGAAGVRTVCPGSPSDPYNGNAGAYSASTTPEGYYFDAPIVAHEFGHQFGASHVFSYSAAYGTTFETMQIEPGHGTSIMSYSYEAQVPGQIRESGYFNAVSIEEVIAFARAATCGVSTPTGNIVPVVNAGADYTIPKSTPFMLKGTASDADGDRLTYNWEQQDAATQRLLNSASTTATGPAFASVAPAPVPDRSFPVLSTVLSGANGTAWEILPSVSRTMNFRFTVRDNHNGGPANNSDDMVVTVHAAAGPFQVTSPNTAVTYTGGSIQTITWSVANTKAAPVNCANVKISLSTDGGLTFPTVLAASTPNDGSESLIIPNLPSVTARIKIEAVGNIFYDISNANFFISNTGVYDITATAAPFGFGTVTPGGVTKVIGGRDQTYTITADPRFKIRNVVVDGEALGPISTYTFKNVNEPHTIDATFDSYSCQPVVPLEIKGDSVNLCGGKNITYQATSAPAAINYEWKLPEGFTWVSGKGKATIVVKTPANFSGGEIKVRYSTTGCGTTRFYSKQLYGTPPDLSSQITGPSEVVAGSTNVYSLPANPDLTYSWSADGSTVVEGGSTNSATIKSGNTSGYVRVTISNACGTAPVAKKYITVKTPDVCVVPTLSALITNVKCFGDESGAINLSASGGTGPFTYQWSGPDGFSSVDEDLDDLLPGSYSVVVTAKGGCTTTKTYSVTQPASALSITVKPGILGCNDKTTSVTITANGGTAPYTGTGVLSEQSIGSHTYSVTDAQGCTVSKTIVISASGSNNPPAAPSAIVGEVFDICGGDILTYTASTVSGATSYEWVLPEGFTHVSGQGTNVITIKAPATFITAQIKARAVAFCQVSSYTTLTINGVSGDIDEEITGPAEVVAGSVNIYSLPSITGFSYTWEAEGATIVDGRNSASVSVEAGSSNGSVTATVKNVCGNEIVLKKEFKVLATSSFVAYPNPVKGLTTVSFSALESDTRFELTIIDSYGRVLMNRTGVTVSGVNTIQLNLAGYKGGIYMVTLRTDNKINCQKLLKAN